MKISTQCSKLIRLGFKPKEIIDILANAGYDCIDFSFSAVKIDDLLNSNELLNSAPMLKEYAQSRSVSFNQAHAPFPSSVGNDETDSRIFSAITKSMEIAAKLGAKAIVVHPKQHLSYKNNKEVLKEINYDFYKSLQPYAEQYGINVALENMWQTDQKRKHIVHSTCADPKEFTEYVDMLGAPCFVACLDIGHCALVGEDIPDFIKALGRKRLKALHIHDVDYIHDNHNLPGIEKLNYDEVMKALAEIGYEGELTLEADTFLEGFEKEFMPQATRFMAERIRFLADKYFPAE